MTQHDAARLSHVQRGELLRGDRVEGRGGVDLAFLLRSVKHLPEAELLVGRERRDGGAVR